MSFEDGFGGFLGLTFGFDIPWINWNIISWKHYAACQVQLQTELRAARSAVAQLMRRTESLLIEKRRLERRLAETWQEGRRLNGAPHVPVADEQSSVSEVSEASWTLVGDAMSGSAVTENSLSDRLAETTGPCCFVAGTMFKGETGALLRIEDVRQGSRILSADGSVVEVASPPTQNEAVAVCVVKLQIFLEQALSNVFVVV